MFKPEISVIVTRYNEPDSVVSKCLQALSKQEKVKVQVYFLDQKGSDVLKNFCQELSSEDVQFEYEIIPAKNVSFARTYGIRKCKTVYIGICDADALPAENWAREIVDTFNETEADIIGTRIIPLWEGKPKWYHNSRFLREFYSTMDLAKRRTPIPKMIGASSALSLKKFRDDMYFDEYFGRKNGVLFGGEETDLCARIV